MDDGAADESRLVLQAHVTGSPPGPLERLSIERAALYAARMRADYHLLSAGLPGQPDAFACLRAWEWSYDKIFWVDVHAVILDACPDVFGFRGFSAAAKCPQGAPETREAYRNDLKAAHGMPLDHVYFDSALMLLPGWFRKKTADPVFQTLHAQAAAGRLDDEILLNGVVARHQGAYNVLGPEWNSPSAPALARYVRYYPEAVRDRFDEAALRRELDASREPAR